MVNCPSASLSIRIAYLLVHLCICFFFFFFFFFLFFDSNGMSLFVCLNMQCISNVNKRFLKKQGFHGNRTPKQWCHYLASQWSHHVTSCNVLAMRWSNFFLTFHCSDSIHLFYRNGGRYKSLNLTLMTKQRNIFTRKETPHN